MSLIVFSIDNHLFHYKIFFLYFENYIICTVSNIIVKIAEQNPFCFGISIQTTLLSAGEIAINSKHNFSNGSPGKEFLILYYIQELHSVHELGFIFMYLKTYFHKSHFIQNYLTFLSTCYKLLHHLMCSLTIIFLFYKRTTDSELDYV